MRDGRSPLRGASAQGHAFVQCCQLAAGALCTTDVASQADSMWDCLGAFPRSVVDEADLVVATCSVSLLAAAFIAAERRRERREVVLRRRRDHVNAILEMTRRQYSDPDFALGTVSRTLRLSQSYLSRAIAAETRYPFPVHLNGVRLLHALTMMHGQERQIKYVAITCGYLRTAELDRQMDRWFGLAPRQFRTFLTMAPRPGGVTVLDLNGASIKRTRDFGLGAGGRAG
jgi:AraC-like DNA-binding protein